MQENLDAIMLMVVGDELPALLYVVVALLDQDM